MDYDALIRDLRSSAKAFRENTVYDSEGDPIRLIVQADEADKAADAIADLRARNDALCDIIFRYVDPCDVLPEDDAVVAGAIAANREG